MTGKSDMTDLFEILVRAKDGRIAPAGLLAVAIGTLAIALIAEHVFGLEPCILCLYQRVPFAVAGGLGLIALFAPAIRVQLVGLAGVVFLVGSGIAVYHTGVEQHWWVSAAGCGGGEVTPMSFAEMKQSLGQGQRKPCDEVDWTLFGISMATYNIFYSAVLGALTLWAARILWNKT